MKYRRTVAEEFAGKSLKDFYRVRSDDNSDIVRILPEEFKWFEKLPQNFGSFKNPYEFIGVKTFNERLYLITTRLVEHNGAIKRHIEVLHARSGLIMVNNEILADYGAEIKFENWFIDARDHGDGVLEELNVHINSIKEHDLSKLRAITYAPQIYKMTNTLSYGKTGACENTTDKYWSDLQKDPSAVIVELNGWCYAMRPSPDSTEAGTYEWISFREKKPVIKVDTTK